MKRFYADLHIHTALSPCAADEMTPPAIVKAALEKGLAMIAICDHNSSGNAAAVQAAAAGRLAVLAGMEVASAEEVHVLGWFPDADSAAAAAAQVLASLPESRRASRRMGEQRLMDASGTVVGMEKKMLSAASALDLSGAVRLIREHGGLAVASHVDRPSFSVFSQLGLLPKEPRFDALEISGVGLSTGRAGEFAAVGLPLVASSDSHFLEDVGTCRTVCEMSQATFAELALALRGVGGRSCACA